jgi:hypothetical protein
MPSFLRTTAGGKAISGGALQPRGRRGNTTQIASYWAGGELALDNSFESIATVTVGAGGSATIEFSGIASTYKHLQIRGAGLMSTGPAYFIRLNSDATANYSTHRQFGSGSGGVIAGAAANQTKGIFFSNNGSPGNPCLIIDIHDYANTNTRKTVRGMYGQDTSGPEHGIFSAAWFNTSAVTTVTLIPESGVFNQYSKFALYGIKG